MALARMSREYEGLHQKEAPYGREPKAPCCSMGGSCHIWYLPNLGCRSVRNHVACNNSVLGVSCCLLGFLVLLVCPISSWSGPGRCGGLIVECVASSPTLWLSLSTVTGPVVSDSD